MRFTLLSIRIKFHGRSINNYTLNTIDFFKYVYHTTWDTVGGLYNTLESSWYVQGDKEVGSST